MEATVLNSLTPLSKAEICKILPDVSPTTVEAVLGAMVKTGSVKTNRIRPDNEIYQGVRLSTMNKQMTKKKAKTRVQY